MNYEFPEHKAGVHTSGKRHKNTIFYKYFVFVYFEIIDFYSVKQYFTIKFWLSVVSEQCIYILI